MQLTGLMVETEVLAVVLVAMPKIAVLAMEVLAGQMATAYMQLISE